ncbi:argonaute-like protein [Mycena filopes]|nr:argonaute-like protein [Mycena filopes]
MSSTAVSVCTNSFRIKTLPTKEYYLYDVAFQPDIVIHRKREQAIHALQNSIDPTMFSPRGVYDWQKLAFIVRLGNDPNAPVGSPGVFVVQITRTASDKVRPMDLNQLIQNGGTIDRKAATAINLLQLLIRQSSNQNNPTNNGRAFFSEIGKKSLPGGIELWRGFFQSVRPTINGMIVTIDTSMAAVYESGPLIEVAMHVMESKVTRDLTLAPLPRGEVNPNLPKLQTYLKNRLIKTRITQERTKTIYGIVPGPIGRFRFHKDGVPTTIEDHIYSVYNLRLKFPESFGVRISGQSAPFPVIIPAELCRLLPGQLYKKRLPSARMTDVIDFTAMHPDARMQIIAGRSGTGVASPIRGYADSEYVRDAGMAVEVQPLILKGKLLEAPRMVFKNNDLLTPNNGSWNALNRRFLAPTVMGCWAVVNLDPARIKDDFATTIISNLMKCCIGLAVPEPTVIRRGSPHSAEKILDDVLREMRGETIDLIVVLLPKEADDIRTRVKFWGDVKRGVRTSCLRENKLQRANDQYMKMVAIKLNARLGGHYALPTSVAINYLAKSPFMIFGADIAHPPPGVSRPSIASVVFSCDPAAAKYIAYSQVQSPRQEMIEGLQEMVKKAILLFGGTNAPPARIFFYRDGVSDGEMDAVKQEEVQAIKNACQEVWNEKRVPSPLPQVSFLSVTKRHHTIFTPADNTVDDGKTGNCRAGLVVEDLRSPMATDFYLQSHAAIKGTSRSCHYSILHDENFAFDVSRHSQLAFELSHLYAKATRSIRSCAPMVCTRGKFHFDPDQNVDFDTSTNASGFEEFDLDVWKRVYRPVSKNPIRNNNKQGRLCPYDEGMYFL